MKKIVDENFLKKNYFDFKPFVGETNGYYEYMLETTDCKYAKIQVWFSTIIHSWCVSIVSRWKTNVHFEINGIKTLSVCQLQNFINVCGIPLTLIKD